MTEWRHSTPEATMDWDTFSWRMYQANPKFCQWEYVNDAITGDKIRMYIINDFTLDGNTEKKVFNFENTPTKRYKLSNVKFNIGETMFHNFHMEGHENHNQSFCQWFLAELLKEKTGDFRHEVIEITAKPYMFQDVSYKSHSKSTGANGHSKDTLTIILYSAMRIRNPIFSRMSFTANEHMWDELGDLL